MEIQRGSCLEDRRELLGQLLLQDIERKSGDAILILMTA